MTARVQLPEALRGEPFSVADGRTAGIGDERMRGRDLVRVFHGVRIAEPAALDLETRCRAYVRRMRRCEVFSHRTAARIHGMPVDPLADGPLDVGALEPHGLPRAAGIRGHRLRGGDVSIQVIRGLRVVSPVDAWCQLAAELGERELVIIGDALVRRSHPFATMGDLSAAVVRWSGRRGCRALARAFARVRPRTDSPAETLLRLDLVAFGLPEPR